MTREEIFVLLKTGIKATHTYFLDDEFLEMKGDKLITEDGFDFSYRFWHLDHLTEGWSVIMDDYELFLQRLFKHLATGNYMVSVEVENGNRFDAKVIEIDINYSKIGVRFESDDLTERKHVEVPPHPMDGFGMMDRDDVTNYEWKNVPVKESRINWKYIHF